MFHAVLRSYLPLPLRELLEEIRYLGLPSPIRIVRPYSLVSDVNLFFLQELARRVDQLGVAGDFVECGVYRGGSAGVLGYHAVRSPYARRLRLYDSFAGMPAASEKDDDRSHAIRGMFVGSEAQTRRILRRLRVAEQRVEIVPGWFEETLPRAEPFRIALLHIDCDFYKPVKLVLDTFYPRLEPLGYVVINDYGCFAGCRMATDEFLGTLGGSVQLSQIDADAHYFQKPAKPERRECKGTGAGG